MSKWNGHWRRGKDHFSPSFELEAAYPHQISELYTDPPISPNIELLLPELQNRSLHGAHGLRTCKTPSWGRGLQYPTGVEGGAYMDLLMLYILLKILRKRRFRLRLKIEL